MGIFDEEAVREFSEGMKSLGEKIKARLKSLSKKQDDKTTVTKSARCPNCGAQFSLSTNGMLKCEYCGTIEKNPNHTFSFFDSDNKEN